jgi:histone H3/H4
MSSKRSATSSETSSKRKANSSASASASAAPSSAPAPAVAPAVPAAPVVAPAAVPAPVVPAAPADSAAPKKSSKRKSPSAEASSNTAAVESKETKEPSAKRVKKEKTEEDKPKPQRKRPSAVKEEPVVATESKDSKETISGGSGPAKEDDPNPCIARYLRQLLKNLYADSTISKDAIEQVQRFVYRFGLHFLVAVKRHLESAKKNTLMMPDMPICLQRALSASTLYQEFSNAMGTALTQYYASFQNGEQPTDAPVATDGAAVEENRKKMWAARAGLSIPPTRTKEFAKTYLTKFRFSQNSITGLTALMESLAQRIFKLSFEKAQGANRKRISHLDVQCAVSSDNELQWLLVEPLLPIV